MANIDASTVNYNQGGTGAVVRTVDKRLQDLVSVKDFGAVGDGTTDDRIAIQAAVTHVFTTGDVLYWPNGTYYMATNSVNNLHDIAHFGPGVIKRVDSLFCPGQWAGDNTLVNRIYVNRVGNSTNDGLTPTKPLSTLQGAIDLIFKKRDLLTCQWEIVMAPGLYDRAELPRDGKTSLFPLRIIGAAVGGHPNIPTTIIGSATNRAAVGLLSLNCDLFVQDILFQNCNGSRSSTGISVSRHTLYTNNVHFKNCYYGVTVGTHSVIDVKGGIFEDCGYLNGDLQQGTGHALRSIFQCKWSVGTQNAGDLSNGPIIRKCAGAARVQELCTGHFDWVTVEDCGAGLRLLVNSRLNIGGASFKRNGTAIYATEGSYAHATTDTVFEGNSANYVCGLNSSASSGAFANQSMGVSSGSTLVCFRTGFNLPPINNTSSAHAVDTLNLAANFFNDPKFTGVAGKKIVIVIKGKTMGTSGTKSFALRLGGSPFVSSLPASAVDDFEVHFTVQFIGPGSQILSSMRYISAGTAYPNNDVKSIDMSVEQPLILNAWVQNSADSISIVSYEWFGQGL